MFFGLSRSLKLGDAQHHAAEGLGSSHAALSDHNPVLADDIVIPQRYFATVKLSGGL